MNIGKQTITVFLDEDGRAILEMVGIEVSRESRGVVVKVAETDDLGLWIQVNRSDARHLVLIRWEYVLSVELPDRKLPIAGIAD